MPPSTTRVDPVTYDDSSLVSQTTTAAISER